MFTFLLAVFGIEWLLFPKDDYTISEVFMKLSYKRFTFNVEVFEAALLSIHILAPGPQDIVT